MRILLIEDDLVIADFITKGLKQAGFVVNHMSDGLSGLDAGLNDSYDLAVIDLMLPKIDGLSIIEQFRKQKINFPIIILSAKRSVDDRVQGLRNGGDDYLTKPFSFIELLARVEVLLRRSTTINEPTTLSIGNLSMDLLGRTVQRAEKKINLQPKEFALLEYLIRNAGRVVSKTMIMERVWNYHFDPCTNVVEARISRLREKIDNGFETSLIHTVRGLGYVIKKQD